MKQGRPQPSHERGAILVHVAVGMVAIIGFSVLSVDYGVLWASRRQAQNAADAGALAGAISLAFVDQTDQALARNSALAVAQQNSIWDGPPDSNILQAGPRCQGILTRFNR